MSNPYELLKKYYTLKEINKNIKTILNISDIENVFLEKINRNKVSIFKKNNFLIV